MELRALDVSIPFRGKIRWASILVFKQDPDEVATPVPIPRPHTIGYGAPEAAQLGAQGPFPLPEVHQPDSCREAPVHWGFSAEEFSL